MSILASYKTTLWIPSLLAVLGVSLPAQQKAPPSPAKQISNTFANVHKNILDMAQDFPAEKYDFRLRPEMRSFGEVIVHVVRHCLCGKEGPRRERQLGRDRP